MGARRGGVGIWVPAWVGVTVWAPAGGWGVGGFERPQGGSWASSNSFVPNRREGGSPKKAPYNKKKITHIEKKLQKGPP